MKRHRLLERHSGSLRWSSGGQETGRISYIVFPHALRLIYRTRRDEDEDWKLIEEDVPFVFSGTAFGGRRRWFLCLSCHRRCRILYGGSYFRCRRCHGLVYGSQFENGWQRALTRAENVRMRLGGSASMDAPFPPKPKGMWWSTFDRLRAQTFEAEVIADKAIMIGAGLMRDTKRRRKHRK
jgi:hypothetical protein